MGSPHSWSLNRCWISFWNQTKSFPLFLTPAAWLTHVLIKLHQLSSFRVIPGPCKQTSTVSGFERLGPLVLLCVHYVRSCQSMCGGKRGRVVVELEAEQEWVIHQSCPSSLQFFICLIAQAWGKAFIMFSFVQTINLETQDTRVPPSGNLPHLATLHCYHCSFWVIRVPVFVFFHF